MNREAYAARQDGKIVAYFNVHGVHPREACRILGNWKSSGYDVIRMPLHQAIEGLVHRNQSRILAKLFGPDVPRLVLPQAD